MCCWCERGAVNSEYCEKIYISKQFYCGRMYCQSLGTQLLQYEINLSLMFKVAPNSFAKVFDIIFNMHYSRSRFGNRNVFPKTVSDPDFFYELFFQEVSKIQGDFKKFCRAYFLIELNNVFLHIIRRIKLYRIFFKIILHLTNFLEKHLM